MSLSERECPDKREVSSTLNYYLCGALIPLETLLILKDEGKVPIIVVSTDSK